MFSKIELPLHIDIISPCLSPLSSNNNEKFRGFARSDISPKKIDQEIYDFWYPEAKKYMRQGSYTKTFSYLSRHLEKKMFSLTEIQIIKSSKLMINAILSIVTKTYLARKENLRFSLLSQLMLKIDHFLYIYYKNLMSLVNSNDGIKKILLKAVNGKNSLSDTRKIPKIHWKNSDEISEKDDSQDNSRIEEPMPIQRINLFIQNKNLVDSNKNNANLMKAKGIEPVPKKTVMFLLDEFFILFLKYMICLSLLEKRKNELQLSAKILLQGYEASKNFENSENTDILSCCIKIRVLLGNFHAELLNYEEASYYYELAFILASKTLTYHSNKIKSKSLSSLSYHFKLDICLGELVIILQNMSFLYELQENYSKCYESIKLSFWLSSCFFDREDQLSKFIAEQFQTFSDRYCQYLHELGDIDRVFSSFFQNNYIRPITSVKSPDDENNIIANQTQAFQEQMYHKFNYDKVNDSLFIPVKSSNNTNNLSQSTNPSRIHSAQPKIPAFLKTNDLEPSLIIQNNRTTSEYLKSVNINYNDNFATSLVIQSPVNEINLLGSPDGVIRTRSFLPEDFKENEVRRKNRVMSEKYDRIGYMKIKTKLSADNGSFGLLNSTYQPKQLTTDKYFKPPVYRVKSFEDIPNEPNTMNSFPDIEKFEKKKTNTPMSALIKHKNEKKMTSRKESTHIRSKIIKTNNSNNTISKENSSKPIMEMEIQDLDDFFSNFIDLKLNQKNQTKPIENIQEEYQEILKDEDFDKKEFDFSKKMLRLKKKYPLPQFNDEQGANEGLNRIKDYTEMLNQANNINMASGVTHYLQQQREAQKELEKEQIAQNIYQSTIILQNKNEESLIKSPKNIDRKNRLKTIILKKNQDFKIRSTLKEFQRSSDKIDSFTRLEGLDHNNPESKKKQQEKIAQVHRTLFLNMIDSYEKELETIDKNIASSSKSKYIKEFTPPTSNNERSYLYMRTKSLYKPDRLTFVKKNGELAFSTNMMSLKAQVAKQKTVGFSDLVNFKMQSSSNLKNKDKRKEKSPSSRVKSRYHQVSFDYLKSVENTMF